MQLSEWIRKTWTETNLHVTATEITNYRQVTIVTSILRAPIRFLSFCISLFSKYYRNAKIYPFQKICNISAKYFIVVCKKYKFNKLLFQNIIILTHWNNTGVFQKFDWNLEYQGDYTYCNWGQQRERAGKIE